VIGAQLIAHDEQNIADLGQALFSPTR